MCRTSAGAGCFAASSKQGPARVMEPFQSSLRKVSLLSQSINILPGWSIPTEVLNWNTGCREFFLFFFFSIYCLRIIKKNLLGLRWHCLVRGCASYLQRPLTLSPGVIPSGMFLIHRCSSTVGNCWRSFFRIWREFLYSGRSQKSETAQSFNNLQIFMFLSGNLSFMKSGFWCGSRFSSSYDMCNFEKHSGV